MRVFPERLRQLGGNFELNFSPCMKKPIPIKAVQIDHPFQVDTLEGNYKTGKAGDYLMCGIEDELYICDKNIFEKTYDWL